eukprot:gnl/MRDRNA2_/MRDRNA2_32383_c0_seq2.p1 gnl/MRDRNA2_/MRDRNA2_32383_c0~~gnl/MRDRNA2_/MRDRNA2_32383_c0_seq2.p1  ORF type:complete len:485 (+),score=85.62 gnl/MRDRNA2_/MRDRNA2_32383_c0_seq2:256-1710(+)
MAFPPQKAIPDVIEQLGFGSYQYVQTVVGGGVFIADGAEMLLIGSITMAVSKEWGLSASERAMVVSIVFIGVLFGNLAGGSIGDMKGRRFPILLSLFGVFLFSIGSAFSISLLMLAALRFMVGTAFGVGLPAWNALGAEIVPAERRLHVQAAASGFFVLGEMYAALLLWVDDPNMKHIDWRILIVLGALPSLVFMVFGYFWLGESPSWLAASGKKQEAKEILDRMRKMNGFPDSVDTSFEAMQQTHEDSSAWGQFGRNLSIVTGPGLLFTTVVVMFTCFTCNFLYYGGLYAFPQVLPEMELQVSPAMNLMIGACFEIPGFIVGVTVGLYVSRKYTLVFALMGMAFSTFFFVWMFYLITRFGQGSQLALNCGFYGFKMFVAVAFLLIYVYAIEVYPTRARSTGGALCVAVGRLGAIVSPLAFEGISRMWGDHTFFFYVIIGLCLINASLIYMLPIETKGAALKDEVDEAQPLKGDQRQKYDALIH